MNSSDDRGRLWLQVSAFIASRTVINTLQRVVYPFLPVFARGLGVDLTVMSLAISLRSATGLVGPLLASIGDSYGRKVGMIAGLLSLVAAGAVISIWPTYLAFVAMLILSILSALIFIPSVQAFVGDRVPYHRRGLVIGLTELAWSMAFIVGAPLVGYLIARGGWQAPFPWIAALGLLMCLVLWFLIPSDRPARGQNPGLLMNYKKILAYPPALAGVIVAIGMSGGNELVNLVFGAWLEDRFAVQIAALATASAVIGFAELGGESLVVGLVDRLGKRRAVALGLSLSIVAAFALPLLGGSLTSAYVGLFLFYITFEFTMVSTLPLMTEVVPDARATYMATFIASTALGRSLTSLVAPWLYKLSSAWRGGPDIWLIVAAAAAMDLLAALALRYVREGTRP